MGDNKKQDKMIYDSLCSLAKGCTVKEKIEEFVQDSNGKMILKSRKLTRKNLAPDLSSIKVLLNLAGDDSYENMSDDELNLEKEKLLAMIKGEEKH